MTTVLFTQANSVYEKLGCDCWNIERDARNYAGSDPVIAHPPCRAWSKCKGLAKPLPGEKELAKLSIDIIRKNGGVLEHPRSSGLFWNGFLPMPGSGDEYGGFSICIDQFWFGHKCQKPTLLYIVGISEKELPSIPYRLDCITHSLFSGKSKKRRNLKELAKNLRSATPIAFAEWLIQVVNLIKNKKECQKFPTYCQSLHSSTN